MSERQSEDAVTDLHVHRLLCAIYPTRIEARLNRMVGWCYARNEGGPLGFVGDRLDDLRSWSTKTRAWWKAQSDA